MLRMLFYEFLKSVDSHKIEFETIFRGCCRFFQLKAFLKMIQSTLQNWKNPVSFYLKLDFETIYCFEEFTKWIFKDHFIEQERCFVFVKNWTNVIFEGIYLKLNSTFKDDSEYFAKPEKSWFIFTWNWILRLSTALMNSQNDSLNTIYSCGSDTFFFVKKLDSILISN